MTNLKNELTDEQRKQLADVKKLYASLAVLGVSRHIAIALAAKSARTLLRRLGYDVPYRHVYQGLYTAYAVIGAVRPVTLRGTKTSPLFVNNTPPAPVQYKVNINNTKGNN